MSEAVVLEFSEQKPPLEGKMLQFFEFSHEGDRVCNVLAFGWVAPDLIDRCR